LGFFCDFSKTGQRNKSPDLPKFAQSGHPAEEFSASQEIGVGCLGTPF
jgi:hypothetical protein